jgi:zinc transport system ATP-binding protein
MSFIEIKNLTVKIEDSVILEDIDIEVNQGEIVSIVGPNGGGKTTLIKVLLGLLKPTSGTVLIDGKDPYYAIKNHMIGYVPQKSKQELDFPVSALDVVLFGLIGKNLSKKEKLELALRYIEYVGMRGFENKIFGRLSGGQQQRIMIARALVSDPKILILDEPSTGVDVVAQESFYEFIKRLNQERKMTIIMVSHDIGAVVSFSHKIAGLNKRLHYFGPAKDFLTKENLQKLYSADVSLLIHSDECLTCQHFNPMMLEIRH